MYIAMSNVYLEKQLIMKDEQVSDKDFEKIPELFRVSFEKIEGGSKVVKVAESPKVTDSFEVV